MRRSVGFREPAKNILIAAEGPTEVKYFKGLAERNINLRITAVSDTKTKPYQIVDYCKVKMKEYGIDLKKGDVAFSVFDVDNNSLEDLIRAVRKAEEYGIRIVVSNPCFEIWLLLHFREHQIPLIDKDRINEELRECGIDFHKNTDYRDVLTPLRSTAMFNSKKIAEELGLETPYHFFDTVYSTNVHKVIELIDEMKRRDVP